MVWNATALALVFINDMMDRIMTVQENLGWAIISVSSPILGVARGNPSLQGSRSQWSQKMLGLFQVIIPEERIQHFVLLKARAALVPILNHSDVETALSPKRQSFLQTFVSFYILSSCFPP